MHLITSILRKIGVRMETETLNRIGPTALDVLLSRRSCPARAMTEPGPSKSQLADILRAGARVPDHGKLHPWRFLLFEGEGSERFADILVDILSQGGATKSQCDEWRARVTAAPVIVGVVSSAQEMIKIPVWEQEMSAGAVCQNILIASHALGFVANWLTEWYAYHPAVKQKIGLNPGERMAGFIYIGTPKEDVVDRPRPEMNTIVSHF
jgi:nitroreductase